MKCGAKPSLGTLEAFNCSVQLLYNKNPWQNGWMLGSVCFPLPLNLGLKSFSAWNLSHFQNHGPEDERTLMGSYRKRDEMKKGHPARTSPTQSKQACNKRKDSTGVAAAVMEIDCVSNRKNKI